MPASDKSHRTMLTTTALRTMSDEQVWTLLNRLWRESFRRVQVKGMVGINTPKSPEPERRASPSDARQK